MNIISLHIGHNSTVSILHNNQYYNIELEKLYKKRYMTLTAISEEKFTGILIEILTLIKQIWNIDNIFDICAFPSLNFSEKSSLYFKETKEIINAKSFVHHDHHHSHAACVFFQSPFDECIILSYDGMGNDGVFNIYHAKDREIKCIKKINNSLGNKYREIALSLKEINKKPEWGWQHSTLSLSGKIMGLSAYGNIRNEWVVPFRKFYFNNGTRHLGESIGLNLVSLEDYHKFYTKYVEKNICGTLQQIEGQTGYDLAKVNQYVFEEIFLEYAIPVIQQYKDLPVCLVGGCSLNVLLNERLRKITGNKIFLPPNTDDSGISLGQLFLAYPPEKKVKNITYSGLPILDMDKFSDMIKKYDAKPANYKELAEILSTGAIVGIMQGNVEVGPRALGNRSILCDPGFPDMKEKINRIKHREWFRPFAPMVKYEEVNTYFDFDYESPCMSFAPTVRMEWRDRLKAITHVDNTTRPQTVRREQHEFSYDLLTEFKKCSGYGVLLNTSFNIKGKPLLTTIEDALEVLETTELDYSYIEGYLFKKKKS